MAAKPAQPLPYQYEPLPSPDTVRLIQLCPARNVSDPLDFEFILHDRSTALSHGVSYDAVSYVWGVPRFDHDIYCRPAGRYLRITATVDTMLRSLRNKPGPRPIWIDALCINQADTDEKSVQVPLMGDIYNQAWTVHIWLGGDDAEIKVAFEVLHTISLRRTPPRQLAQHVRSVLSRICGDGAGIGPVRKLLHKPWFQRRWVIQEVSLSHETIVHCGENTTPWPWFADGLGILQKVQSELGFDDTAADAMRVAKAIRRDPGTMLEVLWEFHSTACYDARDRIFALYGLATDLRETLTKGSTEEGDSIRAIVDYSQPWTETYTLLARHLIRLGDLVGIFRHVAFFGALYEVDPSQPSWTPNWSRERRADQGDFPTTVDLSHFPEIVQEGRLAGGVKVRGQRLGEVRRVCDPWPAESTIAESVAYILKLCIDYWGEPDRERMEGLYRVLCTAVWKLGSTKSPFPRYLTTANPTSEDNVLLCATEMLSGLFLHEGIYPRRDDDGDDDNSSGDGDDGDGDNDDDDDDDDDEASYDDNNDEVQRLVKWVAEEIRKAGEGRARNENLQPPSRNRKAVAAAITVYLESHEGKSKVTSKLAPLFRHIGDTMSSRTLFECKEDTVAGDDWKCAEYFVGWQGVREGDLIVQLTRPQVNRSLLRVGDEKEIGRGLAFVIRPVRGGRASNHKEEDAYRFVGYCHAFNLTDEIDTFDDSREDFVLI